jgi:tetratricopeptide (TPR) repeat protein
LQGKGLIRLIAAALWLGVGASWLGAQSPSSTPPTPAQSAPGSSQDNPFPGDASQVPAPQKPADGKKSDAKPDAAGKPASDNPFPGEDAGAPIIPAGSGASADSGGASGADSASGARRDSDPNGDPVRSPDAPGSGGDDDGFTSSRAGLKQMPVEDDNDGKPGKSTKNKTREQVIKEDLDVGRFYLEQKNWRGAQSRFAAAFALDKENPETVWGLAEVERHLNLLKEAEEHYKLFLSYDPEGPHGRAARKSLEEVEAALSNSSNSRKTNN